MNLWSTRAHRQSHEAFGTTFAPRCHDWRSKENCDAFAGGVGAVAAADYQYRVFRDLNWRRIQVDECWAFVGAKQKNLTEKNRALDAIGDIWLWAAIDADSKLVMTWLLGDRSASTARAFMSDLASRLSDRIQLTSDGLGVYVAAAERAFGAEIDFAQLQKIYGESSERATALRFALAERSKR